MAKTKNFDFEAFLKNLTTIMEDAIDAVGTEYDEAKNFLCDIINLSESKCLDAERRESLDEAYLSLDLKVQTLKSHMDKLEAIADLI